MNSLSSADYNTSSKIAIGARLKNCSNVITLGFKPNFTDYSTKEVQLIRDADKIYYPTAFYANLFQIMGKKTFPSFTTYHFVQDKIRQTALFNLLNIPHPRTKVFYGKTQKHDILNSFTFPFIAKKPRGSSMGRGVYLINNSEELYTYLSNLTNQNGKHVFKGQSMPAYIQEYCPHDRDLRVVIIGKEIALAYWRVAKLHDFRSNLSCGAEISFEPIPKKALELALYTAIKCGWDDVGVDLIENNGDFFVIEANMKYGKKGFLRAGIDYNILLQNLIESGKI
ncbi:MAG: ATP-grasp domain-containing protein [Desulfamplus sp.]|nr:ATP-grasp domain-containing protein [Desulfamplus sp.]